MLPSPKEATTTYVFFKEDWKMISK